MPVPPLEYIQKSFLGGINMQVDPTRIERNEYMCLINGRNRRDVIIPINRPKKLSNQIPTGKIQGLYAAGNSCIIFIDGLAYGKNFQINPDASFAKIRNFKMSADVDVIYGQVVPATNRGFLRKTPSADTIQGEVNLQFIPHVPNPAGLVVQDTISRPWIIRDDGTALQLQDYSDWSVDKREYVPIGRQMVVSGGILYLVSQDGREIFHSVTGRFLDFVVVVDENGEKAGQASDVSHSIDLDIITALNQINTDEGFFVSTSRTSYIVLPDENNLIFGEPTFRNVFLFTAGILNPFSIVDTSGDLGVITLNGIRSFNAARQLKNESNNDTLSAKIYPLFGTDDNKILQTNPCASELKDYSFFAVNTIYGKAMVVYDKTSKQFVSLDIHSGIGQIKQFAIIKYGAVEKLLFFTENNELYEAFPEDIGSTTAECKIYVGDFCTNNPAIEQKSGILRLTFANCYEAGNVTVTCFVDGMKQRSVTKSLRKTRSKPTFPQEFPFGEATNDSVQNLVFDFERSRAGWKIGFEIKWSVKAELSHIGFGTEEQRLINNSFEEAARVYAQTTATS